MALSKPQVFEMIKEIRTRGYLPISRQLCEALSFCRDGLCVRSSSGVETCFCVAQRLFSDTCIESSSRAPQSTIKDPTSVEATTNAATVASTTKWVESVTIEASTTISTDSDSSFTNWLFTIVICGCFVILILGACYFKKKKKTKFEKDVEQTVVVAPIQVLSPSALVNPLADPIASSQKAWALPDCALARPKDEAWSLDEYSSATLHHQPRKRQVLGDSDKLAKDGVVKFNPYNNVSPVSSFPGQLEEFKLIKAANGNTLNNVLDSAITKTTDDAAQKSRMLMHPTVVTPDYEKNATDDDVLVKQHVESDKHNDDAEYTTISLD